MSILGGLSRIWTWLLASKGAKEGVAIRTSATKMDLGGFVPCFYMIHSNFTVRKEYQCTQLSDESCVQKWTFLALFGGVVSTIL